MKELLQMLTYRRPHGSKSEQKFINRFIVPLGAKPDKFGNYWLEIGNSDILWSAHVDTVHAMGGKQRVHYDETTKLIYLADDERTSNCLGADNAIGCWLLCELARNKVAGTYIWHRAEEHGCLGSKYIATNLAGEISHVKIAIAFDRRDTRSVITHQAYGRCCSDQFASSFSEEADIGLVLDNTGLWTDTASYVDLVPECTNISSGVFDEHSKKEAVDVNHVTLLRETLLSMNLNNLVVERDPTIPDYEDRYYFAERFQTNWNMHYYGTPVSSQSGKLERFIRDNPDIVAAYLEEQGIDEYDLDLYLRSCYGEQVHE